MSKHKWKIIKDEKMIIQHCGHCNQVKSLNRKTPNKAFGKVKNMPGTIQRFKLK